MNPLVFALGATRPLGRLVAQRLGTTLAEHEERDFEDGEHKLRPLTRVLGRDVLVLHSLHSDQEQSVNDKLCRLLFFLACLKDHSARSLQAVVPYLCYARKDRRTQPLDPVHSRYLAQLFEAVGVSRVVALDVHNPAAFENAYRCPTELLEARDVLAGSLAPTLVGEVVVVSPDSGGVKRAMRFQESLERALGRKVGFGFAEKRRSQGVVSGDLLAGDFAGRTAVLVDDLIATGTTLVRAARACRAAGADRVVAVATHAAFSPEARATLADPALDRILVSDSIPLAGPVAKVEVASIADLLGDSLRQE